MSVEGFNRFEKIKVPSAYEMVADAIEAEILSGHLRPGDEVGTEAELVRQFGVNRSTVREGIRVLEQGGLVRREAGRRLFVCLPRYRDLTSRLSRAMILHQVTFRELFDATLVVQIAVIEAAALHADENDIAALENIQQKMLLAFDDPVRLAALNTEFHVLIARASKNRVLELAREPAALLFFPTTEMICQRFKEGGERMAHAQKKMIEYVKARDQEGARKWMRRHVVDWRKGFERLGRDIDEPVEWAFVRHGGAAKSI